MIIIIIIISDEAEKWKKVLKVQFSQIRRMGALTLPFRGHSGDIADENCGVYMALLKEVAKSNPVLKNNT